MSASGDSGFIRTFSIILGILVLFMFTVMGIANTISPDHGDPEIRAQKVENNTKPIGKVITDPADLEVVIVVAQAAPAEPRSGEEVSQTNCAACHTSGISGAPKIGDKADWESRLGAVGGIDGLVNSAINGKGAMPPRGGSNATDEEIRAAVEYLTAQ